MTKHDAMRLALADYKNSLGTVIRPDIVTGYSGDDSLDIVTDGTIAVRIVATPLDDIAHDTGGFIDPYWNVEIVNDPENRLAGLHGLWVFGHSRGYV